MASEAALNIQLPHPPVARTAPAPLPPLVNIADYEIHARTFLPRAAYEYYRAGANDEQTLKENTRAFTRLRIRPRFLVDVSKIDMSTTILRERVSCPIALAPTAMHRMAHPHGEIATAQAAQAQNVLMTLSSLSTTSLEDVAVANGNGLRWFQLYVYKDRELTKSMVSRAERAGYKAIVLTVDTPLLGRRETDVRNRFALPPHLTLANFVSPSSSSHDQHIKTQDNSYGSGLAYHVGDLFDRTLSWKDVAWLKSISKLPVIIKGVLTAEDAQLGVQAGADAILVSNHGARQLDGVAATIEVLEEIVKAVNGRCEVYLDGGVRRGTDVFKALALGARAVFIGRPLLWGLSYAGRDGVSQVIQLLKDELELSMQLAGCASLSNITRSLLTSSQALRPRL